MNSIFDKELKSTKENRKKKQNLWHCSVQESNADSLEEEGKTEWTADMATSSPNYFTNYIKPFIPFNEDGKTPKHIYTIEIR